MADKMSAESAVKFIKFSNPSEMDLYHNNLKNKRKNRLVKFLTILCVGLAAILLLHEAYHWQKYCGRRGGDGMEVERVVETIKIISLEKQPVPVNGRVLTLIDDDGDDDQMDDSDFDSSEEGTKCSPGSTKKLDDCNTCRCNEKGNAWSCTKMACVQLKQKPKGQTCVPDSTKMMDCNTCTCNKEGTGYGCTKMACNGLKLDMGDIEKPNEDGNQA